MKAEKIKSYLVKYNKAPYEYSHRNDIINMELLNTYINNISYRLKDIILLDCGCGNGENLINIKNQFSYFKEYIGIDNYHKCIESCLSVFKDQAKFILGDCLDMPIESNSVDIVISNQVIEHIASYGKPIILSTGAATYEEIDKAIKIIVSKGNPNIILMAGF